MKPDKDKLIKIIHNKKGVISDIAKACGVDRTTAHLWIYGSERKGIEKDEELMEVVADARASMVDFAESQAYALMAGIPETIKDPETNEEIVVGWIEKPDGNMIRYFLSKQGADRGYSDKLDVTSGGKPINAPFVLMVGVVQDEEEEGAENDRNTKQA